MISDKALKIYDRVLYTITTLAILIGGFWTLFSFLQEKKKENILLKQQINLTIFNDKKAAYYELVDAASEIAVCNSYEEVVIAQKHFRKLYLGRAHIVVQLDNPVNEQKIDFNTLLNKYLKEKPTESPLTYFGANCLALSTTCKANLDINSIYE